nr:MAG TPA: Adenosylhomocysteinase [Caudoviricetes sp.]
MEKKYLDILTNIIGAVETGGQTYGKRRYNAYVGPNNNTSKELTCTLGWAGNYGERARRLCKMIFDRDPVGFRKADNAGIEKKLSVNWETTKWHPTTAQQKALIDIIMTATGKKCQDELFQELMLTYISNAEEYGVKDIPSQMMWCEIEHLGGLAPVKRIFGRAQKPYTPDTIFASLVLDQKDTKSNTQVGDKIFESRHRCCVKWIKQYVANTEEKKEGKAMGVTVTLAGHGSGRPSKKDMNTYCKGRQSKGRGLVEVLRLPLTDAQRKKMHDYYKEILGRNYYNQNLRAYCYKAYKDGKHYSDCSSSIGLTAQKAGVSGVGLFNTAEMHEHWPKVKNVVIKNGIIQNPEVLKVGDALMFKGSDSSRPLGIGHTEMVYEINGKTAASATPAATSSKKDIVKAGQMHANNFTGAGLVVDGIRGTLTKKAGIMAVQTALNLDFKAGLAVDGEWGPKSDAALKKRSVRLGSTRYLVTAVEILLMLKGYNPNGVECPGQFGSGCAAATGRYQTDHSLKADKIAGYDTIKSLIK